MSAQPRSDESSWPPSLQLAELEMPEQVILAAEQMQANGDSPSLSIARRLILADINLVKMWRTLADQHRDDTEGHWVETFLWSCSCASNVPAYFLLSNKERSRIAEKLEKLSQELIDSFGTLGLDPHFVHECQSSQKDYLILEDYGALRRARVENEGYTGSTLPISSAIRLASESAIKTIEAAPEGKRGENFRAIYFVRTLAAHHERRYGQHLLSAVASAANALFGTLYDESNVHKLIRRLPGQS